MAAKFVLCKQAQDNRTGHDFTLYTAASEQTLRLYCSCQVDTAETELAVLSIQIFAEPFHKQRFLCGKQQTQFPDCCEMLHI